MFHSLKNLYVNADNFSLFSHPLSFFSSFGAVEVEVEIFLICLNALY